MDDTYQEAVRLFQRKQVPEAASLLASYLEQRPDDVEGTYLLGVCRFRMQEFAQAETLFRRLLTLDNGHVNGHYYLALSLERQGAARAARNEYRFTLALDPTHEKAREKVGEAAALQESARSRGAPSPQAPSTARPPEPDVDASPGSLIFSGHREMRTFPVHWCLLLVFFLLFLVRFHLAEQFGLLLLFVHRPLPLLLVVAGVAVDLVLRSKATACEVRERRLDVRRGVVFRKEHSIWVYEIESVDFHRGPWLMLVGSGTVTLEAKGEQTDLIGLGKRSFMRKLWGELRDAALVERRGMKKWWI